MLANPAGTTSTKPLELVLILTLTACHTSAAGGCVQMALPSAISVQEVHLEVCRNYFAFRGFVQPRCGGSAFRPRDQSGFKRRGTRSGFRSGPGGSRP